MRGALYFAAAALVAAVAFWAYQVNYAAQAALERIAELRGELARERESIRVLEAEWAWLNAPDRLQRLAALHAETLALEPMDGARFGLIAEIPFRAPEAPEPAEPVRLDLPARAPAAPEAAR